jgi:hypothetical protein
MLRVSLLLYSVPGSQLLLPNARHLIRTGANKPDEAGPAELPMPCWHASCSRAHSIYLVQHNCRAPHPPVTRLPEGSPAPCHSRLQYCFLSLSALCLGIPNGKVAQRANSLTSGTWHTGSVRVLKEGKG